MIQFYVNQTQTVAHCDDIEPIEILSFSTIETADEITP